VEAVVDLGRALSVKRRLRSIFLNVLLSSKTRNMKNRVVELRRRFFRQPHIVSAFLQLDDPYSYLLAHYLPSVAAHYDIELRLYLSEAHGGGYQPAPEMLAEYAIDDCRRIARELGIPFLDKGAAPPVEHRLPMLDAIAASRGNDEFADELFRALNIFWRGDAEAAARLSTGRDLTGVASSVVADSQKRQERLGHYNSAMLHYEGEWYWGVDRLHYLLGRLDSLGAAKHETADPALAAIVQAMQYSLPVAPPNAARELPPLEVFFSFRSPYSYLALRRTFAIADAFGLDIKLRPVLPMVMRGMQVPRPKLLYIVKDAAREAERLGIAYGRFADPVGAGAERCLAVFQYAESEGRERDFMLNATEAIWARGIDVASDHGMRQVTGKTGLFWPDVKAAMDSDDWRSTSKANRDSMMASGSWGVPTIRMGDYCVWGQDRDWLLVRHIEELCDSGEGILI
jgi:2-hydroxychromene-2-carboxylate isomerase